MATEKSTIEEREVNGKKVRWDKDLGGPITPIHALEEGPEPESKKRVRHGVGLHPRAPDAFDSHRQAVAVQSAQKRASTEEAPSPTTKND